MGPVPRAGESMKRVVLFLLTNLAVLVVLSVVTNLLGLNRALAENGLNLGALLVFSAIIGFGGAFISLLMSKTIARWSTGAQVISEPRSENETWLLGTVKKLADRAGVGKLLHRPQKPRFVFAARLADDLRACRPSGDRLRHQ